MTDRINRREIMIEVAARLFMEHGYTATSVRQIAEEVGCTEAALYYHFKEGKRELLKAVIEQNMPDLLKVVKQCQGATSLHELILTFGLGMFAEAERVPGSRMRWLIAEFPKFSPDERKVVQERVTEFYDGLLALMRPFVAEESQLQQLTWTLIFILFGYGQMMINLDLQSIVDFQTKTFIGNMADFLTLAGGT